MTVYLYERTTGNNIRYDEVDELKFGCEDHGGLLVDVVQVLWGNKGVTLKQSDYKILLVHQ